MTNIDFLSRGFDGGFEEVVDQASRYQFPSGVLNFFHEERGSRDELALLQRALVLGLINVRSSEEKVYTRSPHHAAILLGFDGFEDYCALTAEGDSLPRMLFLLWKKFDSRKTSLVALLDARRAGLFIPDEALRGLAAYEAAA